MTTRAKIESLISRVWFVNDGEQYRQRLMHLKYSSKQIKLNNSVCKSGL